MNIIFFVPFIFHLNSRGAPFSDVHVLSENYFNDYSFYDQLNWSVRVFPLQAGVGLIFHALLLTRAFNYTLPEHKFIGWRLSNFRFPLLLLFLLESPRCCTRQDKDKDVPNIFNELHESNQISTKVSRASLQTVSSSKNYQDFHTVVLFPILFKFVQNFSKRYRQTSQLR